MFSDFSQFAPTNPNQLWLEISPNNQSLAWERSLSCSTPSSRWNAYLNLLVLYEFLPWVRTEYCLKAQIFPHAAALSSIWEVVNGTAINLDARRLVLLPSETIDLEELCVPQEWVDIPHWVADYYLAVQVNPDDRWLRVWSYTTHLKLKTGGCYDKSDRAYYAAESDLIQDLSVLWLSQSLCPQEETRSSLEMLPTPAKPEADNLIANLSRSELVQPRLSAPFELWGALLAHGGWRQQLYHKRLGLPEGRSMSEWLRRGIGNLAREFGWTKIDFFPSWEGARGLKNSSPSACLSRQLTIAGQDYELRILPLGTLNQRIWRFELRNLAIGALVPGGFKLRLLTEDLRPFENNEDIATTAVEQLYIEVQFKAGEGLVWEIEPTPDNYDREILRF